MLGSGLRSHLDSFVFPLNRAGMVLSRDDIRFLGTCICNTPAPSLSLPSSWSLLTHPASTALKKSHQTRSHEAGTHLLFCSPDHRLSVSPAPDLARRTGTRSSTEEPCGRICETLSSVVVNMLFLL